ncbi:hypothetical protein TrLO_g11380 [Triparma laevis f. longispina]|uniref:Uncharacterized protein n=1 Tax=Triparma laevis f. longispina TaxID=1714387 RepID=A0A9W7F1S0_9STRA|nr:hypothetical protein TrLO_g11380 [Triparma laevis f. longispina]
MDNIPQMYTEEGDEIITSAVALIRVQFFLTGREGYRTTNAILIGSTMIVELLIAYGQKKKKSSDFLRDAIATLTGFKPALDAYKVGSGAEK